MKRVIISVSNDLVSDQRVHKVATSLHNNGYSITLIGRNFSNSLPINREYKTKRFRLLFNKGPLFYVCLNCRLFLFLLFVKADIFLSNDLDTLLGNYTASKIRNKKLVYDSHEYFTEVPELQGRNFIKKRWEGIEKRILPKLKYVYTVCNTIAEEYKKKYDVNMLTIRNVPNYDNSINKAEKSNEKIIIYQGALNVGRGIEQVMKALKYIENVKFHIIGTGDIEKDLKGLAVKLNIKNKVRFFGKIPFEELKQQTIKADIGISLEQDMGLNYYYSLPNKIFDYIHAEVPILASKFPEIEKIVNGFKIGVVIENYEPEYLAKTINDMLFDEGKRRIWQENLKKASAELNWQKEEKILLKLFETI